MPKVIQKLTQMVDIFRKDYWEPQYRTMVTVYAFINCRIGPCSPGFADRDEQVKEALDLARSELGPLKDAIIAWEHLVRVKVRPMLRTINDRHQQILQQVGANTLSGIREGCRMQ